MSVIRGLKGVSLISVHVNAVTLFSIAFSQSVLDRSTEIFWLKCHRGCDQISLASTNVANLTPITEILLSDFIPTPSWRESNLKNAVSSIF